MPQDLTPGDSFDGEIHVPGVDRVFKPRKVLVVLLVPLAMSLIAVSSINVALTSIGVGLNASDSDLQWLLSGYALAIGITLVPAGRLGDLFGRGTLFQLGLALFTLGSVLSGFATDPGFLNFARVIQGIGGGMFSPQIMGIIQQTFSGRARAKAFGLFGMTVAVAVAIGPVLAGLLITLIGEDQGWRYTFFINGPFGVLGFILAFAWLPFERERAWFAARRSRKSTNSGQKSAITAREDSSAHAGGTKKKRKKIDLDPIGAILLAVAVLGIMYPFTVRELRWQLVALFIGSLVLLLAWWQWEAFYTRRGKFPMVDLDLLKISSFSMGTIVSGSYFLGSTTTYTIIAMYLQMGLKESAMAAGTIGLPSAFMSAIGARWSSSRALDSGRNIIQLSLLTMIVGSLGTAGVVFLVASGQASFWWLLAPLGIFGFGQGAFGSANQTLSLEDVPVQHGGTAGGVKQTVERISTAIGNAIMTAIFFSVVPMLGYHHAVLTAFIAIITAQTIALFIGYLDLRRARRAA